MELLNLKLENFLCYKSLDLSLKNKGLTLIHGKTGTGKSSIFKAIFYALVDKVDGFSVPELQNWSLKKEISIVKLLIKVNNIQYLIIKEIKGGKATTTVKSKKDLQLAKYSKNWNSTDYKAFIKTLIGIDYETLLNSAYIKQKDINELVLGSYSKRNDILSKFEEITVLEKARIIQANRKKALEAEAIKLTYKLQSLNSKYEGFDFESLHSKYNITENKINLLKQDIKDSFSDEIALITKKIYELKENTILSKQLKLDIDRISKKLEKNKYDLTETRNNKSVSEESLKKLRQELIELDKEYKVLEEEIAELDSKKEYTENFSSEKSRIKDEIDFSENALINLKSDIKSLTEKVNLLEDKIDGVTSIDECDKCFQTVSLQHKIDFELKYKRDLAKYKIQRDEKIKEQVLLERKLNSFRTDLTKINETINSLIVNSNSDFQKSKLKLITQKKKNINDKFKNSVKIIRESRKSISSLENSINYLNEELKNKRKSLANIEIHHESIEALENRQRLLYIEKEKKENELVLLIADKEIINNRIKECQNMQDEIDTLQKILEEKTFELKEEMILESAFAKNGLRLYKIKRMIELLNAYINMFSSHFSDSKICSIEFFINSKSKIDLRVWMQGLNDYASITNLSGGEQDMVVVPVILALSIYISSRQLLNVIFIDEFLTSLDDDKKAAIYNILNDIKENGINVFLITHDRTIKDYDFDNYIYVRQDETFSKISERSRNEQISSGSIS